VFVLASIGGALVSVASIETHSWLEAFARFGIGLFCAIVFTDPVVHWLGYEEEVYKYGIAALLAMTGYSFAKLVTNFSKDDILNLIRTKLGKK
jgi:hypothetical protein